MAQASDAVYFPSQAWFAEYKERINENDEYAESADDWGVGFNGDFIFDMRDLPVDEFDTEARDCRPLSGSYRSVNDTRTY